MQIDVWSDFACPWCALGLRRLDVALEQFAHGDDITVVHRAFELDPHAPARRPETMSELLATKYGMSPEQVRAGHERLAALGREVGFVFDFDRIQSGNTFDAHRLASAATDSDRRRPRIGPLLRLLHRWRTALGPRGSGARGRGCRHGRRRGATPPWRVTPGRTRCGPTRTWRTSSGSPACRIS